MIIFPKSINLHVPLYSSVKISIWNEHFLKTVPLFIKYTGTPVVVLYLPSVIVMPKLGITLFLTRRHHYYHIYNIVCWQIPSQNSLFIGSLAHFTKYEWTRAKENWLWTTLYVAVNINLLEYICFPINWYI